MKIPERFTRVSSLVLLALSLTFIVLGLLSVFGLFNIWQWLRSLPPETILAGWFMIGGTIIGIWPMQRLLFDEDGDKERTFTKIGRSTISVLLSALGVTFALIALLQTLNQTS